MITAAILAAGAGQRIGKPKVLLHYKNRSFLETILLNLGEVGIDHIYVVTGTEYEEVKKRLSKKYRFKLIQNPHPEDGPLSSFKRALEKMPQKTTGCLLILVDHPLVTAQTYRQLKSFAEQTPDNIIIPVFKGKKGHPVYFGKYFFSQLLDAPLNSGARHVVHRNPTAVHLFETDDQGIIADIDTSEDYDMYINPK